MPVGKHLAEGNIYLEKGEDPSLLVLAFNSGYRRNRSNQFELSAVTEGLKCSRIHCKDPQFLWYHAGLDHEHPDIPSTAELLRGLVDELAPEILVTAGASSGGYAALLFGHILQADYVHAFSPNTCLRRECLSPIRDQIPRALWREYERLWALPSASQELFDLATALAADHSQENLEVRTCYNLHVCAGNSKDLRAAQHIRSCPGYQLFIHKWNQNISLSPHFILVHLAMNHLLESLLLPEIQPRLPSFLARSLASEESGEGERLDPR